MNCTSCGKELSEFEEKEYGFYGLCKNCFHEETEKLLKERKCYEDEYEKLVNQLVQQFKGKCLEEAIRGKTVSNEYGDCYLITDECISEFRKADCDNLIRFCKNEDLAIIDIETLGLSFENPIILLGVVNIRKNKVCTHQFLLRDVSEELGAIWSFLSYIENGSTLITYNGREFDIPYIEQRIAYYGKAAFLNNHHYDILHFARRALGKKLPNCRLKTVEKYFGIQREKDIDGFQVTQLYNTYLETRNVGPLVAIVEHNKQDLINLGIVVSKLHNLGNSRSRKRVLGTQRRQRRTTERAPVKITAKCTKCGQTYSLNEYLENKFCRKCRTFLVLERTAIEETKKRDKS